MRMVAKGHRVKSEWNLLGSSANKGHQSRKSHDRRFKLGIISTLETSPLRRELRQLF